MSDGCCGPAAIEIEQFLAPAQADALPIVVIGAGPVGLAAAAHLAERGLNFLILEAGQQVGACGAQWGHVRVFTPVAVQHRRRRPPRCSRPAAGPSPTPDWLPTGAELVERLPRPAGRHPRSAPAAPRARVSAISRARARTGSAPPAARTRRS